MRHGSFGCRRDSGPALDRCQWSARRDPPAWPRGRRGCLHRLRRVPEAARSCCSDHMTAASSSDAPKSAPGRVSRLVSSFCQNFDAALSSRIRRSRRLAPTPELAAFGKGELRTTRIGRRFRAQSSKKVMVCAVGTTQALKHPSRGVCSAFFSGHLQVAG